MKRNYWPLFFIGIFSFVFSMIIWTIKSASSVPIIEDKSFMKKYQDVDDNYNTMMDSNKLFLSKYDFQLILNDVTFPLSTDDIRYSQRVLEKISLHKNSLKVGHNSVKIIVLDKITNVKKDVDIQLIVSKTISADSDMILNNQNFESNDKIYNAKFELKEANNWIITGSVTVDGVIGYIYIKTNAI